MVGRIFYDDYNYFEYKVSYTQEDIERKEDCNVIILNRYKCTRKVKTTKEHKVAYWYGIK